VNRYVTLHPDEARAIADALPDNDDVWSVYLRRLADSAGYWRLCDACGISTTPEGTVIPGPLFVVAAIRLFWGYGVLPVVDHIDFDQDEYPLVIVATGPDQDETTT